MKLSDYKTFEEAEYALMLKLEEGFTPLNTFSYRTNGYFYESELERLNMPLSEADGHSPHTVIVRLDNTIPYGEMLLDVSYVNEHIEKYNLEQEKEFENNIKKEYRKLLEIRNNLISNLEPNER